MAPYFPVTVHRTDAIAQYIHNGEMTLNQPKPAELLATPNEKGQVSVYKKLPPGDVKYLQWRRKLGGMLMQLLDGNKHKGKEFILDELPQGYVLWQQLKYTEGNATVGNTRKKSHATAGSERNDAYLFGHPGGRSKKYRSPQEFFPHLLWLATDTEGSSENCSCKLCYPDKRNGVEEDEGVDNILMKKEVDSTTSTVPGPKNNTSTAASSNLPAPAFSSPAHSAAAPKTSPEQDFDCRPDSPFIYRPGELVWFNKFSAWGLAVVCRRQLQASQPQYLLQPLSHPLQYPATQIRRHDKLRPWLAWSVPPTTHSKLNSMAFDQVPWDRVLRGEFREPNRPGDAEVDGSILAAKSVDASYSLFDRLIIPSAAGETHYNGMFMGGEKLWVGEPVRLALPQKTAPTTSQEAYVLVIHKLVEKVAGASSSLSVVGDVYKSGEMPSPYSSRAQWPVQSHLPARMSADLRYRNEVADDAGRKVWYEWRLVEPAARKTLADIRGRWYETKALIMTLKGEAAAQEEVRMGIVSDTNVLMNGKCNERAVVGVKKMNRAETLGASVPPDTKISVGLNGPLEDSSFGEGVEENNSTDMSQYMHLDDGDGQEFYGTTS